jgi:hypothetical protein
MSEQHGFKKVDPEDITAALARNQHEDGVRHVASAGRMTHEP